MKENTIIPKYQITKFRKKRHFLRGGKSKFHFFLLSGRIKEPNQTLLKPNHLKTKIITTVNR